MILDELEAAYRRISRAIGRNLEDAYEFVAEEIWTAAERDLEIVDAAFFVLIFGQLEARINGLAVARTRREAIRDQKFEIRLELALRGDEHRSLRDDIAKWYDLRNDAAHGRRLARYNISAVLHPTRRLDDLIAHQAVP